MFHDVRFPTDISYGSAGGPEFSTEIIELGSGHERRNQNWSYPRERWDVAYGVKTRSLLLLLAEFFYARRGRTYGFRFKSPDDYQATNQDLGDGDGAETEFQLVKAYTSGGETLSRKITRPLVGISVYIDSVETTAFTLDADIGIVTMDTAPITGEVITADFDFDIPVRFDDDYLPMNFVTYEARAVSVPILELKE